MTHQHLTDLLERAAARTEVGPPPLDDMRRGVARRRRRHAVVGGVGLTVAAVAGAILVPVLTTAPRDEHAPSQNLTSTHSPVVPPSPQQVDIEGTWIVVALPGWNGRLTVGGRHVWIRFHDGRLLGDNGVNTTTGRYVVRDDRFHLRGDLSSSAVGSTRAVPPLAERLLHVRTVARDQGGAYLEDARGRVIVALAPR
jgi:hypothetical protein